MKNRSMSNMDGWFQMDSCRSNWWPSIITLGLKVIAKWTFLKKSEAKRISAPYVHAYAHADAPAVAMGIA